MHPVAFFPILFVSIIVLLPFGIHIYEIYETKERNKIYPLHRLKVLLFLILSLIPLSSIILWLDYSINNHSVVTESKVKPVQVIKNDGFSQQFVLDNNGKVVIMDGYTEDENAQVDTFYYTGSFPFIRSDDKTLVIRKKD